MFPRQSSYMTYHCIDISLSNNLVPGLGTLHCPRAHSMSSKVRLSDFFDSFGYFSMVLPMLLGLQTVYIVVSYISMQVIICSTK